MKSWARALLASLLLFAAASLWLLSIPNPQGSKTLSAEMVLQDASLAQVRAQSTSGNTGLAWQALDQYILADRRAPFWLRFRVQLSALHTDQTQGLWLALRAASEIYLDGQLLGRNGVVANTASGEVAGQVDWVTALPPRDSPDVIEVLVHASSMRLPAWFSTADAHVFIGDYGQMQAFRYRAWLVAAIAYGAIMVACLYFVAIYLSMRVRDRSSIFLLLLGAVGLTLPWLEAWRYLLGYSYPWHGIRLLALQALHTIATALLPVYLAMRWRVRWSKAWIACWLTAYAAIWLLQNGFDMRMWLMHVLGLAAAMATMLHARSAVSASAESLSKQDWKQIFALLLSMLALTIWAGAFYLDGLYFIALAVLMVSLLLAHTRELVRTAARSVKIDAERQRLRAELLKRGMQPHWLLNTLTAMQELIEQKPRHASAMVERLAEEFQNLRAVSERERITLSEEIALCRNHLALREMVHELTFPWRVEGEVEAIELPPGMLHAIIENAFTHSGAAACARMGFDLQIKKTQSHYQLRLSCARAHQQQDEPAPGRGTGSAFIRASLQAAYPERWQFTQYPDADRWIAELSWPCAS